MTDAARNPDDYCYRHPDRLSFVLCDQCGRTICLECQTHLAGRVLCPDDAHKSNVTQMSVNARPRVKARPSRAAAVLSRVTPDTTIITYAYWGVLFLIWLVDAFVGGGKIESQLWYLGVLSHPWTIISHAVSEYPGGSGLLSLLFNAFTLWFLGRSVEQTFGRPKFLLVLGASALGASAFALLFSGLIIDAADTIFGLVGAAIVLIRRGGSNSVWLYASMGISFLSILLSPAGPVLWQGAVGGLIAGGIVGWSFSLDSTPRQVREQRLIAVGVFAILIALVVLKYALKG
jgi:membrane associated rhomboid family serine protease